MFSCFILNTYVVNTGLFINNEFVTGAHTIDTINPATGEIIASVQAGNVFYFYYYCKPVNIYYIVTRICSQRFF